MIGGVVYTWATRGPEDLDRVFGLTDESGAPVDGSLAALRRLFQEDAPGLARSDLMQTASMFGVEEQARSAGGASSRTARRSAAVRRSAS